MIRILPSILFLFALAAPALAEPFTAEVYELGSGRKNLLFHLVRKEEGPAPNMKATAVFTTPSGEKAVEEEAQVENGRLRKYKLTQHQLGESGTIEVKGDKVHFAYTRGGETDTDVEDARANMINAPTTLDFLKQNWPKILNGGTVDARFAAVDRTETVGFKFFKIEEKKADGKDIVLVKMKPTSIIIAAIVDPLIFEFERENMRLLSLKGRTLPKIKVGDEWQDLDAEVVYHYSDSKKK